MGKSYRKTPIMGNASGSEKEDKRIANGKFRKKSKQKLHEHELDGLPYDLDEVYNKWSMAKDGKSYIDVNSEYWQEHDWRRK